MTKNTGAKRGFASRRVVLLAMLAGLLAGVAALLGMGLASTHTAHALDVYDLKTTVVPSSYGKFQFSTNRGMTTDRVISVSGFTTKSVSEGGHRLCAYPDWCDFDVEACWSVD